jgi:hypothetical protein
MKFTSTVSQSADGRWIARHEGKDAGQVQATAASRDEAIEKLKQEIRYRLELCPCTGETYQHIAIEIV